MIKKEPSMDAQKDLLAGYFQRLSRAKDEGRPVVYTFVPGNLVELMAAFDVAPVYPEVNALQYAFLGPLVGAVARALAGKACDRIGGGRITFWVFIETQSVFATGMIAGRTI